ncbi:hypothetical protein PBV87_02890 [Niameybacter massiliensis]|uniref:Uncharacterized protein n=1 Tax=Holtiella tumoricola TaxID=3018743 RepID=A0AA42DKB3_9FIRM|nr:hypothetical protein [Holtiella tumoricola]MDA3730452.1 hypothetical protein [Holtiella tumoricola]
MKIILGAGQTVFEGWISTQEEDLNLLDRKEFEKQFKENSIEAMLAVTGIYIG